MRNHGGCQGNALWHRFHQCAQVTPRRVHQSAQHWISNKFEKEKHFFDEYQYQ
jgi:hypothetical protein